MPLQHVADMSETFAAMPNSFNGVSGLIGQISLVSLSGPSSISGFISHNGLVGFISLGLIGFIDLGLVNIAGLISRITGINDLNVLNLGW